jgi:hypothetical protein
MTDENKPVEPSQKDLDAHGIGPNAVKLDDVQQMGHLVTAWHFNMVQKLHHQLQMPDNVGIDIPTGEVDADGKDICIDGNADHKAGFLAGINWVLEVMDTFPIKGVPEDGEG